MNAATMLLLLLAGAVVVGPSVGQDTDFEDNPRVVWYVNDVKTAWCYETTTNNGMANRYITDTSGSSGVTHCRALCSPFADNLMTGSTGFHMNISVRVKAEKTGELAALKAAVKNCTQVRSNQGTSIVISTASPITAVAMTTTTTAGPVPPPTATVPLTQAVAYLTGAGLAVVTVVAGLTALCLSWAWRRLPRGSVSCWLLPWPPAVCDP